jgi:hypothetical protein
MQGFYDIIINRKRERRPKANLPLEHLRNILSSLQD